MEVPDLLENVLLRAGNPVQCSAVSRLWKGRSSALRATQTSLTVSFPKSFGTLSTVQDSDERRERVRKSSSAGTFMASHPLVKEVLIIGGEGMNIVNDINYMMNFYGEGGGAEKLQKLELTGIVSGIHCNEFNKFI